MQNTLGHTLFKALFYLAFLAFVLIHIGIVISLVVTSLRGMNGSLILPLIYLPAIWLGNGEIASWPPSGAIR